MSLNLKLTKLNQVKLTSISYPSSLLFFEALAVTKRSLATSWLELSLKLNPIVDRLVIGSLGLDERVGDCEAARADFSIDLCWLKSSSSFDEAMLTE